MNVRRLTPQEQAEYQQTAVQQEHAIARRQAAGLSSRRTFVAPARPPQTVQLPAIAPSPGTDLSAAIANVSGTSHDASSAQDRAIGFAIRFAALAIVVLILALAVVLLFVWAALQFGLHPGWFERVLIYVMALTVGLLYVGWKLNAVDYLHSAMGVEHHRLDTLESMHERQMAADLEARRMALAASLKLLERRDDGDY